MSSSIYSEKTYQASERSTNPPKVPASKCQSRDQAQAAPAPAGSDGGQGSRALGAHSGMLSISWTIRAPQTYYSKCSVQQREFFETQNNFILEQAIRGRSLEENVFVLPYKLTDWSVSLVRVPTLQQHRSDTPTLNCLFSFSNLTMLISTFLSFF